MLLFLHYLRLPYLLDGITVTVEVTLLGLAGGLCAGLLLAAMQLSPSRLLAGFARAYTVIFRGTPLILQLVFAYDALPHVGIKLTAVGAAGLALSANEAPFIAELLRAGILGVDRGQLAAGAVLGMTPAVLMRRVVAPQAIRVMVPGFGNEAVSALKNSSLASVIAASELTLRSTQLASSTFDFFSIFFASGVLYLALTGAIALLQLAAERALDLDRPPLGRQLRAFLAPRRVPITAPAPPEPEEAADPAAPVPLRPATARAARAGRSVSLADAVPAVAIRGLHKDYPGHAVLAGLDLDVRTGEVVALLGPSGSGKSTLLRCVTLLEEWSAGTVHVAGVRLGFGHSGHRLPARAIARERAEIGVGMVFQQFNLFNHLTARENVAGPLRWVHGMSRGEAAARADALLARVGLAHRADALPRHLSGGQQQRVAIARALAPRPKVLLLDEPTSALDPELVGEVLDVIRRLAFEDGLTMIISTHQLRFAREVADRVVFLAGGAIVEQGPADEILARPRHPLTRRFLHAIGEDPAA